MLSYQKVTGSLMANSHPGSYCGQDAYNNMLVVENDMEMRRKRSTEPGSDFGDRQDIELYARSTDFTRGG